MYLSLAIIRFLESLPSAFAVGLLLVPLLCREDGARFKNIIAALAFFRAILGFVLLYLILRQIIPSEKPINAKLLAEFTLGTTVGWAWIVSQFLAFLFAGLCFIRLSISSRRLDFIALAAGVILLAVVSLTGHAIDDGLPTWTQVSFFLHTAAGLTWLGGLLGLIWWLFTAHNKPPELAAQLLEKWSLIAKIAMGVVAISGFLIAWENVGSIPNMLATPYGRLLTLKLTFLCAALWFALMIVRYMASRPQGQFNVAWVGKIGAIEAAFGVGLLSIAGYIAVITPASHENDIYWPLPFRLSYIATWGQNPVFPSPIWWWAIVGVLLFIAAILIWVTPAVRARRLYATPIAAFAALLCLATSFSTEAYIDTYNDPTQDFTAESVARGMASFQENCIGCHGPMGEGNGPLSKDLKNAQGVAVSPADLTAPHVGTHTIGDIFHWLSYGQNGVMPSFSNILDVDDRWDVINYLLVLSSTNRSRFIGPTAMIQWLIAPDFALDDPDDQLTTLFKLRGKPTLVSIAHCDNSTASDQQGLSASLIKAAETSHAAGIHHVTVFFGDCPTAAKGRMAVHPKAVEKAYSIMNRYPNVPYTQDINEAHFLIDRSGYIRARFKHFSPEDDDASKVISQAAVMAQEPFVIINLHSH